MLVVVDGVVAEVAALDPLVTIPFTALSRAGPALLSSALFVLVRRLLEESESEFVEVGSLLSRLS
jgi:hypothetical protein